MPIAHDGSVPARWATAPSVELWIAVGTAVPATDAPVARADERTTAAIWRCAADRGVDEIARVGVIAADRAGAAAGRRAGAGLVVGVAADAGAAASLRLAEPDRIVAPTRLPALLADPRAALRAPRRSVLLNPGPALTTARVQRAAIAADLCHREPEYVAIAASLRARLRQVAGIGEDWGVALLSGSGTLADESALRAAVRPGRRALVVRNGSYGERLHEIARRAGLAPIAVDARWTRPVDPAAVAAALEPDVDAIALVHHETTTGLLNPLAAVADIARRADVRLVVDAVSSFGAEPIRLAEGGIDFLAASSNKCLHGLPGAAFVLVSPAGAARLADARPGSVYADLAGYLAAEATGSVPFTPPVPAILALDAALEELLESGLAAHQARYRERAAVLDRGLARLGLEQLLEPGHRSSSIRAVRLPPGVAYPPLHAALKRDGYVIYAGQGPLAREVFRVSCMGALEPPVLEAFVERLALALEAQTAGVVVA
jgi:2-aminoethylphosphonate-pyruvate transaminase